MVGYVFIGTCFAIEIGGPVASRLHQVKVGAIVVVAAALAPSYSVDECCLLAIINILAVQSST